MEGKRYFNRFIAEFGENVMYLKADSAGKEKFGYRWERGIYLGTRDESGEEIIGTPDGVVRAKDFRRIGLIDQRWNREEMDAFNGVPWEPIPGRPGQIELKSRVNIPDDRGDLVRERPQADRTFAPSRTWKSTATLQIAQGVVQQIADCPHSTTKNHVGSVSLRKSVRTKMITDCSTEK
jgi:hypothetical protein